MNEVGVARIPWRSVASIAWLAALLLWETWAPCARLFPSGRERAKHGVRNLALGAINLAAAVGFAGAWRWVAGWAEGRGWGVLHWAGLGGAWHAAGAVLLLDLWTYQWHRWNHLLPWLWRWHRVHHADAAMDVTTANRFHLGEIVLSSVARLAVLPLAGVHFLELAAYETALQAANQWQHANVGLPDRVNAAFNLLLVTPAMHKVHHSRRQPETDSNFSTLFSFWDRMFGTFRRLPKGGEVQFGLDGFDGPEQRSFLGMLRLPWAPKGGPGP